MGVVRASSSVGHDDGRPFVVCAKCPCLSSLFVVMGAGMNVTFGDLQPGASKTHHNGNDTEAVAEGRAHWPARVPRPTGAAGRSAGAAVP